MPMVKLLEIIQNTETAEIAINTPIQNPLMVIDLLITAQKSYIAQAAEVMQFKEQSSLITKESSLIT